MQSPSHSPGDSPPTKDDDTDSSKNPIPSGSGAKPVFLRKPSSMSPSFLQSEKALMQMPLISSRAYTEITNLFNLLYNTYGRLSQTNHFLIKKLWGMTWGQTGVVALLAFLLYYSDTLGQRIDGPVVKTRQGYVKGAVGLSRGGKLYNEYLGIPYALPPVGELRFEPSREPLAWEGVRDATTYGSKCVQVDLLLGLVGGNEDCLFINVFSPDKPKLNRKPPKLLPVMMYVHGGFFHNGGGDFWRPNYFMDESVVLVTFNYRLNSLGFLNTGDGLIRGNMGLKDQTMALHWLQNNIEYFGGDPTRITILGESAGGCASHLHMFSKMSKGLFNNVISESGSALHFWAVNKEPKKQALRFLKQLGCPSDNKAEMVRCLKSANAYDIAEIHRELLDPLREEIAIFKPSVEVFIDDGHTFLEEHPKDLALKGEYNKAPWIFGVNSEEGLITSAAILANNTMADIAKNDWKLFIERVLWFSSDNNGIAAEKIREKYFGSGTAFRHPDPFETLDNYTTMISDRGFNYDAHHGALLQSNQSLVYMYYYSYKGEWSAVTYFKDIRGAWPRLVEVAWTIAAAWIRKRIFNRPLPTYGASHSDELALLFHLPLVSDITPECNDYGMSVDLIKLWVDFAKQRDLESFTQNPLQFRQVEWEPVDLSLPAIQYLRIDTNASMIDEPFADRISFWDNLEAD